MIKPPQDGFFRELERFDGIFLLAEWDAQFPGRVQYAGCPSVDWKRRKYFFRAFGAWRLNLGCADFADFYRIVTQ
jgi:hypothetical protein